MEEEREIIPSNGETSEEKIDRETSNKQEEMVNTLDSGVKPLRRKKREVFTPNEMQTDLTDSMLLSLKEVSNNSWDIIDGSLKFGSYKILNVSSKFTKGRKQPQMQIYISKSGLINVRLNPLEDPQDPEHYNYFIKEISFDQYQDLEKEFPSLLNGVLRDEAYTKFGFQRNGYFDTSNVTPQYNPNQIGE